MASLKNEFLDKKNFQPNCKIVGNELIWLSPRQRNMEGDKVHLRRDWCILDDYWPGKLTLRGVNDAGGFIPHFWQGDENGPRLWEYTQRGLKMKNWRGQYRPVAKIRHIEVGIEICVFDVTPVTEVVKAAKSWLKKEKGSIGRLKKAVRALD